MRDTEENIPKKEGSLFAAVTARSYRVCILFGERDWLLGGSNKTGASRNDLIYIQVTCFLDICFSIRCVGLRSYYFGHEEDERGTWGWLYRYLSFDSLHLMK
jgi:hypothetical protein